MATIEGKLHLDHGVVVTLDCLGQTFTSTIDDLEVHLDFPRAEVIPRLPEEDGPPGDLLFIEPAWATDPWGWSSPHTNAPADSREWAIPLLTHWTSGDDQPTGAASVRTVRLWFNGTGDFSEDSALGTRVMQAKDAWLSRLSNWIECLARQQVSSRDDTKLRQRRTLDKVLWIEAGGSSQLLDIGSAGWFRYDAVDAMTAEGMANVLRLAADDTTPDLAWQLLRDAHHAHGYGEHRRAVVDAASAVEIGCTRWLERRLVGLEEDVAALILGARVTLGPKLGQAKSLGLDVPDDVHELLSLRNQAIHRGAAPNREATARTLATAREALNRFDPEHHDLIIRSTMTLPAPEADSLPFRAFT
ncbi:hypothetical protein [Microbacterium sp. MYb62]|uniref:hypothetical protein n=1 Tax=Microbacterium sp. MYb62 TaxID=1848690 RepID=UPI000CFC64C7|nr:hypothetical protein [Microbacterium sp. MYb62]PRB12207.1 hypothetical protein CQ042_15450 [Microbacterium sp. MYb62]